MKNRVLNGDDAGVLIAVNGSGAKMLAGGGYWAGSVFGCWQSDVENGASGVLHTEGVFRLPKANGVVFAIGADVGWDAANNRVATGWTGGRVGRAYKAALGTDTFVEVRIENTGERRFAIAKVVSAGEDSANSADIDTGFAAVPTRFNAYIYVTATGVRRAVTTITALPGTPGTVRCAEANLAATDTLVVEAVA